MARIAANASREDKEAWLTRPIHWGGEIALIGGALCLLMMFDQNVSWETIAIVSTGGLLIAGAFVLWGINRISNAARGRG